MPLHHGISPRLSIHAEGEHKTQNARAMQDPRDRKLRKRRHCRQQDFPRWGSGEERNRSAMGSLLWTTRLSCSQRHLPVAGEMSRQELSEKCRDSACPQKIPRPEVSASPVAANFTCSRLGCLFHLSSFSRCRFRFRLFSAPLSENLLSADLNVLYGLRKLRSAISSCSLVPFDVSSTRQQPCL